MKMLHTCLRVLDLDATLKFYCDTLGFVLKRKFELPGADATLAFIAVDDSHDSHEIELTYNHGQKEPYTVGDGFAHIALAVEDIDEAYKKWTAEGVTFRKPPHTIGSGSKIAFILDPDGYNIELIQSRG